MARRVLAVPVILLLASGSFSVLFLDCGLLEQSVFAAQHKQASAMLSGVVVGPDDRAVPRARVSYQSSSGRAPHVVRADATGHFQIAKLQADNYDVRASSRGIFSEWEKNISLHAGESKSLTLHLIYSRQDAKTLAAESKKPKS